MGLGVESESEMLVLRHLPERGRDPDESDEDHPLAFRDQLTIVDSYDGIQWSGGTGGMIYPAVAPGCLLKVLKVNIVLPILSSRH